jgi:hypothetical protein
MSAVDHTSIQFEHEPPEMGRSLHRIKAVHTEHGLVGMMDWSAKAIDTITVHPEHTRQGIATGMWNEGHRLSEQNRRIPSPKHSSDRTEVGDAWARSVGGRLPRLKRDYG